MGIALNDSELQIQDTGDGLRLARGRTDVTQWSRWQMASQGFS